MGNLIVGLILLVIVALAVRSIWKDKKSGKGCVGCSYGCSGCSGSCASASAKRK
ncbi:MAG: FeoB-associated Cys-rich membrane protein [Lachnospiraceae bacterium]|nr:FeoB-associated Cys-rich membrane protein [Lachnospiraceae bacterium]